MCSLCCSLIGWIWTELTGIGAFLLEVKWNLRLKLKRLRLEGKLGEIESYFLVSQFSQLVVFSFLSFLTVDFHLRSGNSALN